MKRALISVFDKTNIVPFVKGLTKYGYEIISTGGTYKKLKEEGIEVLEVSEITEFPECFDGRVKTLHPKIHGGILYIRGNEAHEKRKNELDINSIDIVVNNLYPFKQTVLNKDKTHEEIIENIDIGGPSMIRAAAKNYKDVAIIVDPADYDIVLKELEENNEVSFKQRSRLAAKAFTLTAHYDALIAEYFNKIEEREFPEYMTLTFEKPEILRYGENPHQKANVYKEIKCLENHLVGAEQLHGKALSYNNYHDSQGALDLIKELTEKPAVVAAKHANPCGVAEAESLELAFKKAFEADPISIYGGIVAVNREVDLETAEQMSKIFLEVVMAPSYSEDALKILTKKKNIRLLKMPNIDKSAKKEHIFKSIDGGLLIQNRDLKLIEEFSYPTNRKPTEEEMKSLMFGWKVVKHAKSNGIVLAKEGATVGVGPGQVSRIWALENAIKQAKDTKNSVMASDAFFPFRDCVDAAYKAGITAIIQPGGSVRDQESIDACNEYGIAMIFTGMRHFKH